MEGERKMNKLFVPYEIAREMQNLGFSEMCFGNYNSTGIIQLAQWKNNLQADAWSAAPLWQQAIDWLREEHNIEVTIKGECSLNEIFGWTSRVHWLMSYPVIDIEAGFDIEYYEALKLGIEKAIELLKESKK